MYAKSSSVWNAQWQFRAGDAAQHAQLGSRQQHLPEELLHGAKAWVHLLTHRSA